MEKLPSVLLFDVNETLLDLEPVKRSVATVLGGRQDLVPLWFTTLLQYSLVTTVSDRFEDFGTIGAATLRMVAKKNQLHVTEEEAYNTTKLILELPPYPEVKEALSTLRDFGYRLAALTNSSQRAMEQQLNYAGFSGFFEEMLSVERIGMYKPHQHVYRWAAYQMQAQPEDCMMVAAHGWDVAGAKWANMSTAFIERPGQTQFPLAPEADVSVGNLQQLSEVLSR